MLLCCNPGIWSVLIVHELMMVCTEGYWRTCPCTFSLRGGSRWRGVTEALGGSEMEEAHSIWAPGRLGRKQGGGAESGRVAVWQKEAGRAMVAERRPRQPFSERPEVLRNGLSCRLWHCMADVVTLRCYGTLERNQSEVMFCKCKNTLDSKELLWKNGTCLINHLLRLYVKRVMFWHI